MMHPAGGMMQPPMAAAPPPQQQWPMMAPPPAPMQQAPPPPQWIQPPPQMWNQQPSHLQLPQPMPVQAPMPSQYQAPIPVQTPVVSNPQAPASADEVKTLWIGDLQHWMDETYVRNCFGQNGEVLSVKLIRNKQTGQLEGYGFIEFAAHATAERVLQTYNGTLMPNTDQTFRLNWASFGSGERRGDEDNDFTVFVGDLAPDVTDYMLQETFGSRYFSVKGAKVVTDRTTGRSKGYGFVRFRDANEHARAMTEMNGVFCSSRAMRVGPAAIKKTVGGQQLNFTRASYQNTQGTQSESDLNNTTIFVGGLDSNVSEEELHSVFSACGELIHVRIPVGKRCGFVQFANRACAEEALQMLHGTLLGSQNIRLSWGRTPSNKQSQQQQDANRWNGNYYGYGQSYGTYGYGQAAPQDPTMYAYGGAYAGYQNYQQQPVNYQQQPVNYQQQQAGYQQQQ